jgi:hypothetical protein
MNYRTITIATSLALASTLSFAQTPAADAGIAKHSCAKPALPDAAKKLTVQERNAIVASLETYRTCIRAFSDGQEKIKSAKEQEAKSLQESSQAALAAAKAAAAAVDGAVNDYNALSAAAVKIIQPKDEVKKTGTNEAPAARPSKSY